MLFDNCCISLTIFGTFWQYFVHFYFKNHATDFAFGWTFPLRAYNAVSHVLFRALMVLQVQLHMVMHIIPVASHDAHRKAIHVGELPSTDSTPGKVQPRAKSIALFLISKCNKFNQNVPNIVNPKYKKMSNNSKYEGRSLQFSWN